MSGPRFTPERLAPKLIAEVRARSDLAALIGARVPLKRAGRELVGRCPFHAEKTPSFYVVRARGFYHCFGCGAHGDAIAFARAFDGLSFVDAVRRLAVDAGLIATWSGNVNGARMPLKPKVIRPEADADEALRDEERRKAAHDIWRRTWPAAHSPVEIYLRHRGIRIAIPKALRFAPRLAYVETRGPMRVTRECPAMVAAVQGPDGKFLTIHRTYLAPDGRAKAEVPSAKKIFSRFSGGAVRFAAPGKRLAIAEGIETTLSVMQACPGLACWSALALGNMAAVAIPDAVNELILCADADNKDPRAAERVLDAAARAHWREGRTIRVARPPQGMDFNDVLTRGAA